MPTLHIRRLQLNPDPPPTDQQIRQQVIFMYLPKMQFCLMISAFLLQYLKLVKMHHPDMQASGDSSSAENTQKFMELKESYQWFLENSDWRKLHQQLDKQELSGDKPVESASTVFRQLLRQKIHALDRMQVEINEEQETACYAEDEEEIWDLDDFDYDEFEHYYSSDDDGVDDVEETN